MLSRSSIAERIIVHSSRQFSGQKSTTTIPPNFGTNKEKIKDVLDDSMTSDERLTVDSQTPWPNRAQRPKKHVSKKNPPIEILDRDDSENTVILFPGQGTQFVGMGQKLIDQVPSTKLLFDKASSILEYDLLKLCLNGPKELLDKTEYCQPAVLVASLAAVEVLWEIDENAVKNCVASAGFSLGELTALIFSGVFSFEDGIKLVKARGKAMQEASDLEPQGMMTIFYGKDAQIGLACEAARKWISEKNDIKTPVCQAANHLYVGGKVLGGHMEALDFIEANKKDFAIRKCKKIPVSGAFHTSLMKPAQELFNEAFEGVAIAEPRIPVYSNYDNRIYTSRNYVQKCLIKQMVNTLKWESSMQNMVKYKSNDQWPKFVECGPGQSLSTMIKQLNGKIGKRTSCVSA